MGDSDRDDTEAKQAYDWIVSELAPLGAQPDRMFGMPCLKLEGKAIGGYFQGTMVFKLRGEPHARALAIEGAHLFDPSNAGRPMKEWVVVPFDRRQMWSELAHSALDVAHEARQSGKR